MKKPTIVCHMMTSIDGRIDCDMTASIPGSEEYYQVLEHLDLPSTVSGKVTAAAELTDLGEFKAANPHPVGKPGFQKNVHAIGYEIIMDTNGTLLWDESKADVPHLIIMSEKASQEYLDYLNSQKISWIVCGKDKIDLHKAVEILASKFCVDRLGIVGGGTINAAFLEAGLIDELSVLIGCGIDGRKGQPSLFDGLSDGKSPQVMKLWNTYAFENGAVWLHYHIEQESE